MRAVDGLTIATTPPVTPLSYLQAGSTAVSAFLGRETMEHIRVDLASSQQP